MEQKIKNFHKHNYICFSINIKQRKNKDGIYKKEIQYPKDWENSTVSQYFFNSKYNGIAIPTGKINNIIVVDIDNTEHWNNFLQFYNQPEPDTVKAISGSGGLHYYFKYTEDLDKIKSTSKCFSKNFDIDIRTNGGNIIAPPTGYFNMNTNKEVKYMWEKDLFAYEMKCFPDWMKNIILEKNNNNNSKNSKIKTSKKDIGINFLPQEIEEDDKNLKFSVHEIEKLLKMLSKEKCDDYTNWISVGLCLHNISELYLPLWEKWSSNSPKYISGDCENNWNNFKKNNDGLKIGSLLLWAKQDNLEQYNDFINNKKFGSLIKHKYPKENLIIGDKHNLDDKNYYVDLKNKDCLIKGGEHDDMPYSMYIDIIDKFMTVKCRHPECFGKRYPCNHMITMTKNEMNIAFNGDITININNNDDELVEFNKIDIYEDQQLNELIFNSLNGEAYPFAKIIYYFYKDEFRYSESEDWFIFSEHKWKCIGKKNMELRDMAQEKLKSLYSQLLTYYKNNESDKQKIKSLKNIMKSFDNTNLKNNVLIELSEIFTINENQCRNFLKKLDSNHYLIGFNNGVYDLINFEFREGIPSDYITMSVGFNYSPNHTEKYSELLTFLEEIQPDEEERNYMLTYLSVGLIGNLLELFTILTGCGRNGKSKLIELLKFTMGDYFGSVQSTLFTRPRPDANSPDPGLLNLMHKRIVIASEPEKNSKLNSGFIKFVTGRDSTTLRNCHSNDMIDFTANFITLLICNDIPDCDDMDNAFSKRLRCINFPTEFVDNPVKENQKKINVNVNKNFDLWKLDFMLLLIDFYKGYVKNKELKLTNEILKWTNQYKENTDLYLQFINEHTQDTPNDTDKIHCVDLYEAFKNWFKFNNPNTKIPSDREFMKNIRKYKRVEEGIRIGEKIRRGIRKIKFIDN